MGSGMKPILIKDFLEKTEFNLTDLDTIDPSSIQFVIGLRNMKEIISINAMSKDYLNRLLLRVGTTGSFNEKVYENAKINFAKIDPHTLRLGQKFVYRKNYTAILENFPCLFGDFHISRGISKLTAFIIFGKDENGNFAMAHYLPPIIEIHEGHSILLDGVHRNFIVKNSGTTIEAIIIQNVKTHFPCASQKWDEVLVIDHKPEKIEDRYFDLKPELFRDLKSIGIDG